MIIIIIAVTNHIIENIFFKNLVMDNELYSALSTFESFFATGQLLVSIISIYRLKREQ